ncbi:MAG: response regulator [Gammaproteobacteria bacterium]|nr:response regulator [Gammaproteobacteria bacterium]
MQTTTSIEIWFISLLSLAYLASLFFVAYWGQKQSDSFWRNNSLIYSLSIGVSCTSWAFYGIIGQAAVTGQWLTHIYIGTMACFILGWPMLLKMLRISKQQNLTSIADFIACRYDKTPKIAALVTLIALVGTIPYIALQLRAISQSFDLISSSNQSGTDTTFIVAIVLSIFSVLFGARHVVANKQNQGLIFAIAFSSIIKLLAITAVGIFVTFIAFDGFNDLVQQHARSPMPDAQETSVYLSMAHILLGFVTIFITPQLYHVIVIENNSENQLKKARWLYPLYLVLINIFVLPIAMAGQLIFVDGSVNADTFILTLPLSMNQEWLSLFVYIGGLAAATSMVIVAVIVLSTMFSTEILTPALIRSKPNQSEQSTHFSNLLLNARRTSIVGIMLLALLFERLVNQQSHLSSIGLLSFVLLAQFAPAVIGALYWRLASSNGAVYGLITGSVIWFYTLLVPTLWPDSALINEGLFSLGWLKPTSLFGINFFDETSHGVFISMLANTLCFIVISLNSNRSIGEKIQAEIFLKKQSGSLQYQLKTEDLYNLLTRFVNNESAEELLQLSDNQSLQQRALVAHVEFTRKKLVSVLGTASTRLVMSAASEDKHSNVPLEDVATIVDEANQLFQFNRELLQAGVENIEQGISVVDADMRLVAWNQRYIELLDYPEELIQAGMHISDLITYNANRNLLEGDNVKQMVDKRIAYMRAGNAHHFQRVLPSGLVVEIRGQAMPGGGFVSTFSDITDHIKTEKILQEANENLELKVIERTHELSQAKAEAEAANKSKSRFLAAASHDLMQPFNALSLFTDMLKQQVSGTDSEQTAQHIQDSLSVVEGLITDLVEISKLEAATQKIDSKPFSLTDVLRPLNNEFQVLAKQQNIEFHCQISSCWINSDRRLVRRVLQNFLSNAFHYSPVGQSGKKSRVLLGVKRYDTSLQIQVWDNGPGIPIDKQSVIFKEFERLEHNQDKPGLGLGLAISDRIAKLLGVKLNLLSTESQGSMFSMEIPRLATAEIPEASSGNYKVIDKNEKFYDKFTGLTILIIDNDELLLSALKQQILLWTEKVIAVKSRSEWLETYQQTGHKPDVIIADYHLKEGENGVQFAENLFLDIQQVIPCVICSADPSEELREHVSLAQFSFIRKPVKALALRKMIKQMLYVKLQSFSS